MNKSEWLASRGGPVSVPDELPDARREQAGVQWRPIETAPRDGVILLWFPDLKEQEAQFGYWHVYEDAPWYPGEWRDRDNSEEFIRGDDARVHPTHWAPAIGGPLQ